MNTRNPRWGRAEDDGCPHQHRWWREWWRAWRLSPPLRPALSRPGFLHADGLAPHGRPARDRDRAEPETDGSGQTALRQAILRGLDNRTLRPELAANSRRIAVEEYGLMTMARHYLELYKSVAAG